MRLLVLGAGYIGARLAELALREGHEVVLADNWYATDRTQLAGLEELGARVKTADIRRRDDLDRVLAERPERLYLFAAQASRPLSERDPDYTEETNVTGTRRVAEAVECPVVFASSLHVYGDSLLGRVGADRPYGAQGDLAHLSKIYAEQALALYSRRRGFGLALLRLGIVYGRSPVEHDRPESQTVVDKFRRLARAGEPLSVHDARATVGVVHVDDVARIFLAADGPAVANVAAEAVTVADIAALALGDEPAGGAAFEIESPFEYRHRLSEYMRS